MYLMYSNEWDTYKSSSAEGTAPVANNFTSNISERVWQKCKILVIKYVSVHAYNICLPRKKMCNL